MKQSYKPSGTSLVMSFLWDFSPATVAFIGYFFAYESASAKVLGWLLVAGTVVMGLLSLFLTLQTIIVHLQQVTVDENNIAVTSPFGTTTIAFPSVTKAVLRERVNQASKTDRLIIIQSQTGVVLTFNPSTLSREDEDDFLDKLRRLINLEVIRDKPAL